MVQELVFRSAMNVKDEALGNVFGLQGLAQLGPYDSRSSEIIIRFWDDSIRKPLLLAAPFGLPPSIESTLSSVEPVRVRFKVNARRGLAVVGCQVPTKNGKEWSAWQDV
jgi:hypothetical protein